VYGYFPCQSDGNDVVVYEPDSRRDAGATELVRFTFPRQREGRQLCISDFFANRASGKMDVIGFSLVTIGAKASAATQKLFEGGEYTKYLYLHGLSVETAEGLAELHHKKMREELGFAARMRRRFAICSIRSIAVRGIHSGIRRARIWRTRRSCLYC
jgi:5-methyltetrahydrofolate--homocysteine methyltransferase